jgi:branched-chain amino acid aminotransferase
MENKGIWILHDGSWQRDGNVISSSNRSFLYGDGIFETMRVEKSRILFLENHIERLHNSLPVLQLDLIDDLTSERISKHVEQFLIKNKWYKSVRIRLTVYRKAVGKFTPENSDTGYMLSGETLDVDPIFPYKGTGRIMGVYNDELKSVSKLAALKTTSSLFYVLAGAYAKKEGLDDVFVCNQSGEIIETVNSNILLIKGRRIFSPGPEHGALDGTMRKTVLQIGLENGYDVLSQPLQENDILEADEIMLTNAIQGINWVKGFKERRYYSETGAEFSKLLNELVMS